MIFSNEKAAVASTRIELKVFGQINFGDAQFTQHFNIVHTIDISRHEVVSVVGGAVEKDAITGGIPFPTIVLTSQAARSARDRAP